MKFQSHFQLDRNLALQICITRHYLCKLKCLYILLPGVSFTCNDGGVRSTMKQKHLLYEDRLIIERELDKRNTFTVIAAKLHRDATTISKEVRRHITIRKYSFADEGAGLFNDCVHRYTCKETHACDSSVCHAPLCKRCGQCIDHCPQYQSEQCPRLLKPPYVCNGCKQRSRCRLAKHYYKASDADSLAFIKLKDSRKGSSLTEEEVDRLNKLLMPLLKKNLSIHAIYTQHKDEIMYSERSLYNFIDEGILQIRNIDLLAKVRYKPRKTNHTTFKVDKKCRINRTFEDYKKYLQEHPTPAIVQLDSVIGQKGGKVLLTMHFVSSGLMLGFIRDYNTSASVTAIFNQLYQSLGHERFTTLFPVILTDNGAEFTNPTAIEFANGEIRRTRVYYCDPFSAYQKGAIEKNHEFIRRILPKGSSFDALTQRKVNLMMSHINSYPRQSLGNKTPYGVFQLFYGKEILKILGIKEIPPTELSLCPELLK